MEVVAPPPPQPLNRNAKQTSIPTLSQAKEIAESFPYFCRFWTNKNRSKSISTGVATGAIGGAKGKLGGAEIRAGALPLVVTVIVKLTAVPFVTFTLGALQFVPNGIPEHTNVKAPLNPAPCVACRLNVAIWPEGNLERD